MRKSDMIICVIMVYLLEVIIMNAIGLSRLWEAAKMLPCETLTYTCFVELGGGEMIWHLIFCGILEFVLFCIYGESWEENKTKMFSKCPTCGATNHPDNDMCHSCGNPTKKTTSPSGSE